VSPWRTIDQLADVVGAYCWLERRIFALTGAWASAPAGPGRSQPDPCEPDPCEPELRVFLAAASRRHAELAECWYERLPQRAGVDRAALVVAPSGALADYFEHLDAAPGLLQRTRGLVDEVLARLVATYADDLAHADVVNEGSVMAVLTAAVAAGTAELAQARRAVPPGSPAPISGGFGADTAASSQWPFTGFLAISPAARAS